MQIDEIINKYLTRGFGSMNKNDFEVWIFNYLLQHDLKGLSDNAISRYLRIPESKIKRLRYEAELKNPQDEDSYKERFYDILRNRVYKITKDNRIQFSITDKAFRLYLDDLLEKHGSYADSSFNSNVVTISATDLMLLISFFENKQTIVEQVQKSINETDIALPKTSSENFKEGIRALINDLGGKIAPNVTKFILDAIEDNINKKQLKKYGTIQ